MQSELHRFAYKLTADRDEANDLLQETSLKALDNMDKYIPDTNFKGWMYTIMRNIFINNYRKIVRDQTFVDHTDNLYHMNQTQEIDSDSTEGNYDIKENTICYAHIGLQVSRNSRKAIPSAWNGKEPYIFHPTAFAVAVARFHSIVVGGVGCHPLRTIMRSCGASYAQGRI